MFSFTIAEFTFLCVGFAFVGSLILFPSFRQQLSANRAQTVANYLASQGIDQNRLIITGSGNAKYQADKAAGTLSGDASVYQSTDISFLRIEN